VPDEMEFEPLAPSGTGPGPGAGAASDLRRLSDVPVDLTVEIGRTRMTVAETLQLRPGSIVSLNRTAGEPVDLLVNGTLIARGEVVAVDEEFGLRITEVLADRGGDGTVSAGLAPVMPPAQPAELEAPAPDQADEDPPIDAVAA